MIDLLSIYLKHFRPLLWSLTILVIMVAGLTHTFYTTLEQVKQEHITLVTLPEEIPHTAPLFTKKTLEKQLNEYREISKTQPQHRDLLVNIALLQKALRNQKEAFIAWEDARKLDPNNPLFTTTGTTNKVGE
jgi:cytochrome c-type biogenesis protein CcmH/NrfG